MPAPMIAPIAAPLRACPPAAAASALPIMLAAGLSLSVWFPAAAQAQPASAPGATPGPGTPSPEGPVSTGPLGLPDKQPIPATLAPFQNRVIRAIKVVGLRAVDEQLVRNQIRSAEGAPLSVEAVQADVRRLNRLGRFSQINARVQPYSDQTVELTYEVVETQIIKDVQAVGNRQLSDQEIGSEINILAGTPVDRFQIDRGLRRIKDLYKKKGYYQADVQIDEKELSESGIVLFRIREGERLRITDVRFEGNTSFEPAQLGPSVKTKTWGLFESGALDDNQVDQDVAAILNYYKDRGRLDVRVDREIRPSPDGREAILTFIIDEGPVYTLRTVKFDTDDGRGAGAGKPPEIFTTEQIAGLMQIKAGDVYSLDKIRRSVDAINEAYGKMGYLDARVSRAELRDTGKPVLDLLITVSEGRRFTTGVVLIKGNDLTQQKVIRRQILVQPDRPLDTVELKRSEQKLREVNLFDRQVSPPRITIQPEDIQNPGQRDVLVEVKETNTGSLSFGAAVNSDAGVVGQISLTQRNFDILDTPDSFDELIRGRAFRGAGQDFSLSLQPGTEIQNYIISLGDEYLFESEYGGNAFAGYRVREYDEYKESRLGGSLAVGRRFGEVWSGTVFARGDAIDIRDVTNTSILDLRAVEGRSAITGVGIRAKRSTLNSNIRPSSGTKFDVGVERVGALGGDYDFTKISSNSSAYFTIAEDFLGRKTVLHLRNSIAYIPEGVGKAPVFERLYLGGRDFRGFRFRGVSPRGFADPDGPGGAAPILTQDPRGGAWSFFAGAEVEQPLLGELVSFVVFCDSGTVTDNPSLSQYRVSLGGGLRVYVPQLGPAPLAFDFGFPVAKQEGDQKRIFSFSLDVPF